MNFDLKSKPILISFVLGALILVAGISLVALKIGAKPAKVEEQTTAPVVKTEEGNPRVIVTEPEKYAQQMEEAAKNAAPTTPVVITISDANFVPAEITVTAPFIVTFKNAGVTAHSVKGTSGKWGSLKDLEPGESYSQQFDVAGIYEYSDPLNPDMKGKVVVE